MLERKEALYIVYLYVCVRVFPTMAGPFAAQSVKISLSIHEDFIANYKPSPPPPPPFLSTPYRY
jgi:hypothetical protein